MELRAHNLFADTQDVVTEALILTFRNRRVLEEQLHPATFSVTATYET